MDHMSERRVKGTSHRRRSFRPGALVAGVMLAAIVGAQVPMVAVGATVESGTLTVEPDVHTAGATTTYTVHFHNTNGWTTGQLIFFDAATGTKCPDTALDYSVTAGGSPLTVKRVGTNPTFTSVSIELTGGATTTTTIAVTISDVVNPQVASTTVTWTASDSPTYDTVTSGPFTIKGVTSTKSSVLPPSGTRVEVGKTTDVTVDVKATGDGTGTATAPRPVPGDLVTLSVTTGVATITGTTTGDESTTDATGVATFQVSSMTTGTVKVSASDGNVAAFVADTIDFVATPVTTGKVTPASHVAGATTRYTVTFKTSTIGSIGDGGTITLTAPTGTKFPASASKYSVQTTSHETQTVTSVGLSTATKEVVITLTPATIGDDAGVTVTITGVVNPTDAHDDDVMAITTEGDVAKATSTAYQIVAGAVDAATSELTASPTSDTSAATVYAQVKDQYGNSITGVVVGVTASSKTVTVFPSSPTWTISTGGYATFTAIDAGSGSVTFTAKDLTTTVTITQQATVTFKVPTKVTGATVALTTDTAGKTADYTVTFSTSATGGFTDGYILLTAHPGTAFPACTDSCGSDYVVKAATVAKAVHSVVLLKAGTSATFNEAVIRLLTAGITNSQAISVKITGAKNLTLSNPGYVVGVQTSADAAVVNTTSFTIVPTKADAATSQVSTNHATVPADGITQALISVTARDKYGNLVTDEKVTLAATGSSKAVITPAESGTTSSGVALFTATDTTAQKVTFTATLATPTLGTVTQTVTVTFRTPTQVSGITVGLSNPDTNEYSEYTIGFTASAQGALGTGSSIALSAPAGTYFPGTRSYYAVSGGGGPVTVGGVVTFDGATSSTPNIVVIALTNAAIGDGQTVSVVIGFVANPTIGSTSYTMSVGTSSDTAYPQAASAPYAVNGPGVVGGYWLVAADGGIFTYGDAAFHGSTGNLTLNSPIVGMAVTPDRQGYWLVAADGGIFAFGDAKFYGSMGGKPLNSPIVGMAATATGAGYWLVASDGGIFAFGDAKFYGSMGGKPLNKPIVGIATLPDGDGYWMVASDGGIFSFGTAAFFGSTGSLTLNRPIVGMAPTADGKGYWLVASDGGIFNYGDASFHGSAGSLTLNAPIVGMTATARGAGYTLVAADGGIFTYGTATFYGSAGSIELNSPIVGMAS